MSDKEEFEFDIKGGYYKDGKIHRFKIMCPDGVAKNLLISEFLEDLNWIKKDSQITTFYIRKWEERLK